MSKERGKGVEQIPPVFWNVAPSSKDRPSRGCSTRRKKSRAAPKPQAAGFVAREMNFRKRISATGDRSTNSKP